ncbi:MAG: hypothetical protein KKF44_09635, partial [Nanoarchaeota archaeon]|nr:hypothetical protein [Nanoarchaeota archaeon]
LGADDEDTLVMYLAPHTLYSPENSILIFQEGYDELLQTKIGKELDEKYNDVEDFVIKRKDSEIRPSSFFDLIKKTFNIKPFLKLFTQEQQMLREKLEVVNEINHMNKEWKTLQKLNNDEIRIKLSENIYNAEIYYKFYELNKNYLDSKDDEWLEKTYFYYGSEMDFIKHQPYYKFLSPLFNLDEIAYIDSEQLLQRYNFESSQLAQSKNFPESDLSKAIRFKIQEKKLAKLIFNTIHSNYCYDNEKCITPFIIETNNQDKSSVMALYNKIYMRQSDSELNMIIINNPESKRDIHINGERPIPLDKKSTCIAEFDFVDEFGVLAGETKAIPIVIKTNSKSEGTCRYSFSVEDSEDNHIGNAEFTVEII